MATRQSLITDARAQIKKINLYSVFKQFDDYWYPIIVGQVNDQHVRIVKFQGEFMWHTHEKEDEMLLVIRGHFSMELDDESISLSQGEFIIIPRGTMHKSIAEHEVEVLLFGPETTANTGNEQNNRTREIGEKR